jgi:hypothetical protein
MDLWSPFPATMKKTRMRDDAVSHAPLYKDSTREYRYCAAVGPRWLAGKEIWWCVEMDKWELNHAEAADADGRGDIPTGWCVSVLWGIGSAGQGYMLKFPSLNGPYLSICGHSKTEWAYIGPDSICFLRSFLAVGLYCASVY